MSAAATFGWFKSAAHRSHLRPRQFAGSDDLERVLIHLVQVVALKDEEVVAVGIEVVADIDAHGDGAQVEFAFEAARFIRSDAVGFIPALAAIDRQVVLFGQVDRGQVVDMGIDALAGCDPSSPWLREKVAELLKGQTKPTPILQGRHLLAAGFKPGVAMGPILAQAFEAQLDGLFSTEEEALAWLGDFINDTESE